MHKLSPQTEFIQPSDELFNKVMLRISREQELLVLKKKLYSTGLFFLLNLALVIPAWIYFKTQMAYTGFGQYFSLIFSDLGNIGRYWQDFALTLLESFPALAVAGFLVILFFSSFCAAAIADCFKGIRSIHKLTHQ
ncbi:MAG: hypothetical protein HY918_03475 [Candidatus Doudnabacteria bacterium]|nr:hypothetical protein [Candidatus Doudnabacteria bacterium]